MRNVRALILLTCLVFAPAVSHAAYLYIDPGETELYRGDTITLAVRVDTDEGECINTIDASLTYSGSIRAVDVSRGESILSVWVEEPTINREDKTITFAGGVPGGYCGRIDGDPKLTNIIAELVFRAPGLSIGGGSGNIGEVAFLDGTRALLNDGFGTPARIQTSGASVIVNDSPGQSVTDDWNDRVAADETPPADFSISLDQDPNAFSGKYFISFNTIDKQSGIDHYEVMEEPFEEFDLFKWGAATAPWIETQSPYVLKDQSLNSTIRVKAIDKAGNQTIAVYVPDAALRAVSTQRMIIVGLLATIGVLIIGAVAYAIWRRKRALDEIYESYEGHDEPDT